MVIMLFGITNVGKTATGQKLAAKMNYAFFDMDAEIKRRFQTTLENFMNTYPWPHERHKIKGQILKDLLNEHKSNMVIAVCPIYYTINFTPLLKREDVIAIELQDSKEHIFERLIFSDVNDNIYRDDEYKEKHKKHYLREIQKDITDAKKTFSKVEHKYFINNRPIDQVVDDLVIMIGEIMKRKSSHNDDGQ